MLFLEIFSKLYVANDHYESAYAQGCYLADVNNNRELFYNLNTDKINVDNYLIWKEFKIKLKMYFYDIQRFLKNMIEKYFELNEVEVWDYSYLCS